MGKYYPVHNHKYSQSSHAVNKAIPYGMEWDVEIICDLLPPCVNGQRVAYAIGLARLHAHGWDPLIPTDAGVYDGLQEEPRYVYLAR